MTRKVYHAYGYTARRVRRRANLNRKNFRPKHNFSILFLFFLNWHNRFGSDYSLYLIEVCNNRSVKYEHLEVKVSRIITANFRNDENKFARK